MMEHTMDYLREIQRERKRERRESREHRHDDAANSFKERKTHSRVCVCLFVVCMPNVHAVALKQCQVLGELRVCLGINLLGLFVGLLRSSIT
jgi:hypothetical protein